MCLTIITNEVPEDSGTGWAIFRRKGKDIFLSAMFFKVPEAVPGKELEAVCGHSQASVIHEHDKEGHCQINASLNSLVDAYYPMGFHIFLQEQDAVDYLDNLVGLRKNDPLLAIRKVTYRGAHTSGKQGDADVIVARYRTIIKEEQL